MNYYMPIQPVKPFKKIGRDCQISQDARIFGYENIEIGDNVRIDAGVTILAGKGRLKIGSHVHIACGVTLACGGGIEIGDFCFISFNSMLISASDDFGGNFLVGPVFPEKYLKIKHYPIVLERLSGVGAGGLLLPGARLEEGAVLGAMSQMRSQQVIPAYKIAVGSPSVVKKDRSDQCKLLADIFELEYAEKQKKS